MSDSPDVTGLQSLLGLDVGLKRIGVARVGLVVRLPQPLLAVPVDGSELAALQALIAEHTIDGLVVGLPRSLDGNDTEQTRYTRSFAEKLQTLGLPLFWQDEAGTSVKATQELNQRRKQYSKGEVDSLAAVYILEDFLGELQ